MTGLLDRLRGWFGSLGGSADDTGEEDEADADEPRIEGSAPTVTHRDDRPLETPDPSLTAAAESVVADESGDADAETDAGATADDGATDGEPGPVSIPDAEGGTTPGPKPTAERATRSASPTDDGGTADASAGVETEDAPETTVPDEGDADGFECAVCGTAVEEPSHSCPLCRSTEVVPATRPDGES